MPRLPARTTGFEARPGAAGTDVYPVSALDLCKRLRLHAQVLGLLATDGLIRFTIAGLGIHGRCPRLMDVYLREVDAELVTQMLRPENIVSGEIARYLDVLPDSSPLSEHDRTCALGRFLALAEGRAGRAGQTPGSARTVTPLIPLRSGSAS